ncbi:MULTISPECIES: acyl-homoserine-lactone synthase [unclassified Mesorhizobium]|uniref:acyl-homoserine-lactone synthase n=1 Tax=unclassified Mesorhizobium TaxID=325217 RepID=UPI001CCDFC85|nr:MULTISPECIES: acyl-homoserine-lactone synthase [unclassified Mesorhizobium]MBZ9740626.1 GNAT family N-acetyltransferase [Mesorhizobium sp. CO1-1-4]MBZ9775989.1 GNAT family N-acetyltransferase [Mesorhizobium sp. CO1-1-8]
MFKVHVVDAANRVRYREQLDQYFQLRHQIYVGERGWHALKRPDGREIDAFDTPDATHLLGITAAGQVVAGSRLVPSLKPHLMSEVFPQLVNGLAQRGQDISEWTRFFVARHLREPGRSCQAAGIICCGVLELCLQRHIRHLTIVCEDFWFERFASIGWSPKRLGPSKESDGMSIIGIMVDISPAALTTTRQIYRIGGTVLCDDEPIDSCPMTDENRGSNRQTA